MWALNLTVTKYILQHGLEPLVFATIRVGAAGLIFVVFVALAEGSLAVQRRDLPLVFVAALGLCLNQLALVHALDGTTASTIALILGATPIFAGLGGLALGLERLSRKFWLGSVASFAGVCLVAVGGGGALLGNLRVNLLGVTAAAALALFWIAIAPLMERYSPSGISAVVLPLAWMGIAAAGAAQTTNQDYGLGWKVWALFMFATIGPFVVANILWFHSLHSIGAARASLAGNLQPFVAAVFAVVLLSETVTAVQIAGGALIVAGILFAGSLHRTPMPRAE